MDRLWPTATDLPTPSPSVTTAAAVKPGVLQQLVKSETQVV